jgi:uncharacterized damage-inducible protein DinB
MAPMSEPLTVEQAVLGDLDAELEDTRRVLERIPDDALGFRPHPGAWTLHDLAHHVVQLLFWHQTVLDRDGFDVATAREEGRVIAPDRAGLLARFDELRDRVRAAMGRADAPFLGRPWTLRAGPQVLFTLPRAVALRRMCTSHLVHHRAQLALCLRMRGVAPPPLYSGPSGSA